MRILLHSYAFYPSIGGIETVSKFLAERFTQLGHPVTIVTQTPGLDDDANFPYEIVRNPQFSTSCALARKHEIIVSNGASVKMLVPSMLASKPFVWIHQGYRLTGIDCGWLNGAPAPYELIASIKHHVKFSGWPSASINLLRLVGLKAAAKLVTAHVAVSQHVANRQPLPSQIVIPNPYPAEIFRPVSYEAAIAQLEQSDSSFTFLGRLVSEKGVDTLLQAFALLAKDTSVDTEDLSLKIIGDGPQRLYLQELAIRLGIERKIVWTGFCTGEELAGQISHSGICVVPSSYEEPMGVVALELMAAGKPLIVSRRGGLSESCGDACLTFENNQAESLYQAMKALHRNKPLQHKLIAAGLERLRLYDPDTAIRKYLDLFESLVCK